MAIWRGKGVSSLSSADFRGEIGGFMGGRDGNGFKKIFGFKWFNTTSTKKEGAL